MSIHLTTASAGRRVPLAGWAVMVSVLAGGCNGGATAALAGQGSTMANPTRLTHPFVLFTKSETNALAKRKDADELLAECWSRLEQLATPRRADTAGPANWRSAGCCGSSPASRATPSAASA